MHLSTAYHLSLGDGAHESPDALTVELVDLLSRRVESRPHRPARLLILESRVVRAAPRGSTLWRPR